MPQNIFQPETPDIATPTFIQQGVADTSTAKAISTFGGMAVDAYKGRAEAQVETEVEGVVGELFKQKAFAEAVKDESDLPLEQRLQGAEQQTKLLAEQGFGDEDDLAQKEMAQSLSKLQRAKDIGSISENEFLTRVEVAVKRGTAKLPGLASDFQKIANDTLGRNKAGLDEIFEAERMEKKAALEMYKKNLQLEVNVAKHYGLTDLNQITPGMRADFQASAFADNALARRKTMAEVNKLQQEQGLQAVINDASQGGSAILAKSLGQVGQSLNTLRIQGDETVATLRAQDKDVGGILKGYFATKENRTGYAGTLKNQLRIMKGSLLNHYNNYALGVDGVSFAQLKPTFQAQLDVIDNQIASIDEMVDDADMFSQYVESLDGYNKGAVVGARYANPAANMALATGTYSTFLKFYLQDPKLSTLPPVVANLTRNVMAGLVDAQGNPTNPKLLDEYNDQAIAGMTGQSSLQEIEGHSKDAALYTLGQAYTHIDFIKKNGFVSDKEGNNELAKEAFVNSTQLVLDSIKPTDENAAKIVSQFVNDPTYMSKLSQLSPLQKERVTEAVESKFKGVINGVPNTNTGILNGLRALSQDIATRAGGREGEGRRAEVLKELAIAGDIPDIKLEGINIVSTTKGKTGRYEREYQAHDNKVKELNKMLQGLYTVKSLTGGVGTYKEFVGEFFNQVRLKQKPKQKENKEEEQ